jgi:c-di-GMP-binding flagellar brake protein YcgR
MSMWKIVVPAAALAAALGWYLQRRRIVRIDTPEEK